MGKTESRKRRAGQTARETLFFTFDALTDPAHMTRKEYRDFLGEVIADSQIREEAAKHEDGED